MAVGMLRRSDLVALGLGVEMVPGLLPGMANDPYDNGDELSICLTWE